MVQTVTELMEQGYYFVVGKQCGFISDRRRQIAGQIGNWNLGLAVDMVAVNTFIHPGTTAFIFACVQIQIELTDSFAGRIVNRIETNRLVPYIHRVLRRFYIDAIELFYNFKQPVDNVVVGEVWF